MAKINVQNTSVSIIRINDTDFISLTDIAKHKTTEANVVIANWMRNRNTIEFLGLWEILYNPTFKPIEFEGFKKQIGWSAKRELAKLNYHIHTDAIKNNLIPKELSAAQTSVIYASEADVLNMALFGETAKQWRDKNPELKGNMRDYASINELICLSNMENLNAVFIQENIPQKERLIKLNKIAIQQMQVLQEVEKRKWLK